MDAAHPLESDATCPGMHCSGLGPWRCGEKLAYERLGEPGLVPFRWPSSVYDEQPVHLRRHKGVNDVTGITLP